MEDHVNALGLASTRELVEELERRSDSYAVVCLTKADRARGGDTQAYWGGELTTVLAMLECMRMTIVQEIMGGH